MRVPEATPRITLGELADLAIIRRPEPGAFTLDRTCVGGVWTENPLRP